MSARMAGMPMGPLELMDSIGIDTGLKVAPSDEEGSGHQRRPIRRRISSPGSWRRSNRPGRKTGKGFYDYDAKGKRVRLWPELLSYKGGKWKTDADVDELKARFLTIQALEAARCFEEGVITDPRDADVGAILGWGYAPFTGGPISYIDTIGRGGVRQTLRRVRGEIRRPLQAQQAAARHGGEERNVLRPLRAAEAGGVSSFP